MVCQKKHGALVLKFWINPGRIRTTYNPETQQTNPRFVVYMICTDLGISAFASCQTCPKFQCAASAPSCSSLDMSKSFPRYSGLSRLYLNFWMKIQLHTYKLQQTNTVDGRNPANQLVGSLSHCLHGFYTSQLVQDFFHQQHVWIRLMTCFH